MSLFQSSHLLEREYETYLLSFFFRCGADALLLGRLALVLGHALELTHRRHGVETKDLGDQPQMRFKDLADKKKRYAAMDEVLDAAISELVTADDADVPEGTPVVTKALVKRAFVLIS